MNRKIEVTCTNCHSVNCFSEGELISDVPTKDANGNVLEEHPPVTVDGNTLIACDVCGYPVNCANAKFSD